SNWIWRRWNGMGCALERGLDDHLAPQSQPLDQGGVFAMQLFSVNVGRTRAIQYAKQSGTTGIFKIPVQRQGDITRQGLSGDAICDVESDGGPDEARYVYGTPAYA